MRAQFNWMRPTPAAKATLNMVTRNHRELTLEEQQGIAALEEAMLDALHTAEDILTPSRVVKEAARVLKEYKAGEL